MSEAERELGGLKIVSADEESWLRIARLDDGQGYDWWAMEVSARTGSGARFSGANHDVHFMGFEAFIAAFDGFILDRSKPAALEGTYDCRLCFAGNATGVRLEFTVGDASAFGERHAVSGVFSIAQDMLLPLLAEFRALSAA